MLSGSSQIRINSQPCYERAVCGFTTINRFVCARWGFVKLAAVTWCGYGFVKGNGSPMRSAGLLSSYCMLSFLPFSGLFRSSLCGVWRNVYRIITAVGWALGRRWPDRFDAIGKLITHQWSEAVRLSDFYVNGVGTSKLQPSARRRGDLCAQCMQPWCNEDGVPNSSKGGTRVFASR